MPHCPPTAGFVEQLGALCAVYFVVDILGFRFVHSGLTAAQIRHAAGPDFLLGIHGCQQIALSRTVNLQGFNQAFCLMGRNAQQQTERKSFRHAVLIDGPARAIGGEMSGQIHKKLLLKSVVAASLRPVLPLLTACYRQKRQRKTVSLPQYCYSNGLLLQSG